MTGIFTDLDSTLIYSGSSFDIHRKGPAGITPLCVEHNSDGTPITYMTYESRQMLSRLLADDNIMVIPVTARNLEQTKRVDFTSECKVWVCESGTSVYINGEPDTEWDKIVDCLVDRETVAKDVNTLKRMCLGGAIAPRKILCDGNVCIFLSFDTNQAIVADMQTIHASLKGNYTTYIHKNKVYLMTAGFGKHLAVMYLKKKYGMDMTYGAGDSRMDLSFLSCCKHRYQPRHSDTIQATSKLTVNNGILASDEILKMIIKDIY